MLSLRPRYLKRYRDVARLLIRYGRSDLVHQTGLAEALEVEQPLEASEQARAEELASDLEQLGPTFIKLGQLLSTRPDLLPPPYVEALTRLQDEVAPFAFDQVQQVVERELGAPLNRVFQRFDEAPLASASLSQVHQARLADGRLVAVKVQRPGIRETIVHDLDALAELADLLDRFTEAGHRYEFAHLMKTLRRSILRELDFRTEAQHLVTLRNALREFPRILVPYPVRRHCTHHVLVMDYVPGKKITTLRPDEVLEGEREALVRELFQAYLHQVVVAGVFHADPHPGNLFFTDDRRIALLDLGLVVRVPPRLQEKLLELLLAISEGRAEEAAAIASKIGRERRTADKGEFHQRIIRLVTDTQGAPIERLQMGHVVLEMRAAAAENGVRLPDEITMISKTLLNLEKTLLTLDPNFDMNLAIRERVPELLQRRARGNFTLPGLYHALIETNEFVTLLPERLNKIMDRIAENELRVHVDAIDEAQLIQGIQKVANRITTGVVLAALIIGAALMMDVDTEWTWFGYPAIAMFFFLAAGTGSLLLVLQILLKDRRS